MLDKKYDSLIVDPIEFLKPLETYAVEVVEASAELYQLFPKYFKPNPPGLYMPYQVEPVVAANQAVWVSGQSIPVDYDYVITNKVLCFNESGTPYFPAEFATRLTDHNRDGFYNIDAVNYIKLYLVERVKDLALEVLSDSVTLPDVTIELSEDRAVQLLAACEKIIAEHIGHVHEFMRDDCERIYFVRNTYNRLVIQKCGDLRAYLWTRDKWDALEEKRRLEQGY